jgi:hypothetical protein
MCFFMFWLSPGCQAFEQKHRLAEKQRLKQQIKLKVPQYMLKLLLSPQSLTALRQHRDHRF